MIMVLCDKNQYFDPNTKICSMCAESCDLPGSVCPQACRGLNETVTVVHALSAIDHSADDMVMMIMISIVIMALVLVVLVASSRPSWKCLHTRGHSHRQGSSLSSNRVDVVYCSRVSDTMSKPHSASNSVLQQPEVEDDLLIHSDTASVAIYAAGLQQCSDDVARHQQQQQLTADVSVSLVSYDVEARMKMLGWLNSQVWVSQYFEVGTRVHIAVENIDRREAYTKIRQAADNLVPEFEFEIVEPLVGKYTPCSLTHVRNGIDTTCVEMAKDRVGLTPGVKISCERMEPRARGEKVESGCALYSGTVKLFASMERGLTVGHLFEDVGLECTSLSSPMLVGRCSNKITFIDLVDSLRKTTADLALIDVFCPANNTIVIDGVTYLLKLYEGFLNSINCYEVAILSYNGQIRYGQMDSTFFTVSALGLYNTLSVVDPDNNWSRVNNPGDSGALVISVPDPKVCHEIVVYGMVIGYFESEDGTQSKTVATRLWDILSYVNKMSQFHVESGYVSNV